MDVGKRCIIPLPPLVGMASDTEKNVNTIQTAVKSSPPQWSFALIIFDIDSCTTNDKSIDKRRTSIPESKMDGCETQLRKTKWGMTRVFMLLDQSITVTSNNNETMRTTVHGHTHAHTHARSHAQTDAHKNVRTQTFKDNQWLRVFYK